MDKKRDLADVIYENRNRIIAVVVALVVLIVGLGFIHHLRTKERERAAYYYSKGLEKLVAVINSGNDTEKELKEALSLFKKAEKIGVGKESKLAVAMEGKVLIMMGKEKEGRKLIERALKDIKGKYLEPVMVAETRDPSVMKEYLEKDNPFFEDYVRFQYAMFLLSEGKKAKAKEQLKLIKGKFPDSPFSSEAERILEVLK